MMTQDTAKRAEELARDLAEAFEIALAPGWNRLYPETPRTPNLWADIHTDAQACWLAVASRALHLVDAAVAEACKERDAYIADLKRSLQTQATLAIEARREERQKVTDIVMTHALVQGRYSEQAERNNQPAEAKEYWQAYRALKLAADDLRPPASAPEGTK